MNSSDRKDAKRAAKHLLDTARIDHIIDDYPEIQEVAAGDGCYVAVWVWVAKVGATVGEEEGLPPQPAQGEGEATSTGEGGPKE